MNDGAPTVFLVDDEPAVLKAISRLLRASGLRTVTFESSALFLQQLDPAAAGCLVLDMAMPEVDGMQVQAALGERGVVLPIIFLTGRADVPMSVSAMKRGAADFLTKPVDGAKLIEAVGRAIERDGHLRREQSELSEIHRKLDTLTPREREVMALVVAGLLNKQIAMKLGTAEKTIKVHRARVMEKMGAGSLAELVRIGERVGVRGG
jgi:FixJ family two-component response regulator